MTDGPVPGNVRRGRTRQRGGVALSAVLPGVPQLLAGRWGTGMAAFGTWMTVALVLAIHPRRVAAAWGGALDGQLALATLVAGLLMSWAWSIRDVRQEPLEPEAGEGSWAPAQRAFARNRLAVVGLLVILAFYLVALLAPLLAPYDPSLPGGDLVAERLVGPSLAHPLGTDQLARDVLSRVLYGARVSLSIGFVAIGISVTLGTLVGALAGYVGGAVDAVLMRVVDMIISFPRLILLIAVVAMFEPSIFVVMVVLGLTQWPSTARLVRAEVLSLREREFVQAARALGFSRRRIILRHLIPNTLAPIVVAATLGIGNVIVVEAGLSFLGLGVQPPTASWGGMVADGRRFIESDWWVSTFPGLAIVVIVLAFNVLGDGLMDALNPRSRRTP